MNDLTESQDGYFYQQQPDNYFTQNVQRITNEDRPSIEATHINEVYSTTGGPVQCVVSYRDQ